MDCVVDFDERPYRKQRQSSTLCGEGDFAGTPFGNCFSQSFSHPQMLPDLKGK
jgi:hypothetical protein